MTRFRFRFRKAAVSLDRGILPAAVSAAAVLERLPFVGKGHPWGDDFAEYFAQARAIVSGDVSGCIADFAYMTENSDVLLGPAAYPWGLPVCIAPFWRLFGLAPLVFKGVVLAFLALFAFGFARTAVSRFGRAVGSALSLAVLSIPVFVRHADNVLSDVPFLCTSFFACLLASRLFPRGDDTPRRRLSRADLLESGCIGVLFFASCQFRTDGFILPMALVFASLSVSLRRAFPENSVPRRILGAIGVPAAWRIRETVVALSVFAVLTALSSLCLSVGGEGHAHVLFDATAETVLGKAFFVIQMLPEYIGVERHRWKFAIGLVVLSLSAVAAVANRKRDFFPLVFVSGVVTLAVWWPGLRGPRAFFCCIPWVALWAAGLFGRLTGRNAAAGTAAALAFLFWFGLRLVSDWRSVRNESAFSESALDAYRAVSRTLPRDAVVSFEKPRILYLMTGRLGVLRRDPARIAEISDYALVCRSIPFSASTGERLRQDGRFARTWTNGEFELWEKDVGAMPESAKAETSGTGAKTPGEPEE